MKAFRFRGARILEWRRVQADAARAAFVRANESVREASARLAQAGAACDQSARDYVDLLAAPSEVGTLVRYRNWIDRQRGHVEACRLTLAEGRVNAEAAAETLQVANRQVKVMERLRDRARRRYLELERQMEMKDIDQLATMQYARRLTEKGADREY